MTDGRWAVAGLDRNALRPMRYTQTADGLLVVGSESGMVLLNEETIVAKGRLGPGEMIGVDMAEGRLYRDEALKDRISAAQPYADWVGDFTSMADLPPLTEGELPPSGADLRRLQIAAGLTTEDMELILSLIHI